jgi:hypothetical protein
MMIYCPKCKSKEVISYLVSVSAYATVHLNTWDIVEIDDAVFEDPTAVEKATCGHCDYQWEIECYIGEDSMYAYRPINDN